MTDEWLKLYPADKRMGVEAALLNTTSEFCLELPSYLAGESTEGTAQTDQEQTQVEQEQTYIEQEPEK